jgi:hypothetical protein
VIRSATAQAGAASTITLDVGASAVDNFYNDALVYIVSGSGAGQARVITGYVGATQVATISPNWITNPSATSVFVIYPASQASVVSGGIRAASFATDAIDANALATSAVTEIQAGLASSASVAAIQADTDDIQTRLPAALVGGRIDASVGAMAAGTITATVFAANAIDANALAADAVTEIQAGLATSAALATVQADTDNIQTRLPAALVGGRIDASVGAMAASTITATAFATDAIDANALAASAVTEIQAGLATSAALATVQADTDNIQTRLPAALVGGRIDASVGAMAAGTITATVFATDSIDANALAASAVTEIQAGLATSAALATVQADTDDIQTRLPAALVGGRIDASVGAMAVDTLTAAALAADAVTEIQAGLATSVSLAAVQADTDDIQTRLPATLSGGRIRAQVEGMDAATVNAAALSADAVAEIADGVWDEAQSGHLAVGTFGLAAQVVRTGTAQAGGATSITLDAGASAIDNFYTGALVLIADGTGALQARAITGYVGATKVATVDAWITAPDVTSVFVLLPESSCASGACPTVAQIVNGVWDEPIAAHLLLGSTGDALNTAALTGGLTPTEATQLDEVWKIHGLSIADPLVVTPLTRDAGPLISQALGTLGTTVTVTRNP